VPVAKKKPIPEFRSEDEEREFWARHDSTGFIDWRTAGRRKFPNLKPTLRTISLRLPVAMIEDLKVLANKRDVPYQSLLKVFLAAPCDTLRGIVDFRRRGLPAASMETGAVVSINEYLSTSYDPDCDFVDGVIEERNLGENDHAELQTAIAAYLRSRRKQWGIYVVVEQRVQVSPTRFRVRMYASF